MDYPTPHISHLLHDEYVGNVYDVAEDSFLLMDALQLDATLLHNRRPLLCLEIGSGSGAVITFLSAIVGKGAFCIATDINPMAGKCTLETARINQFHHCDVVLTDLVSCLSHRMNGKVDILLFNPPYVVTAPEEIHGSGIEASWAGGKDGREVIDRLLSSVPELLSSTGLFYLVTIKQNKPDEIITLMSRSKLNGEVVLSRKAGNESLCILRFDKENLHSHSDQLKAFVQTGNYAALILLLLLSIMAITVILTKTKRTIFTNQFQSELLARKYSSIGLQT